MADSRVYTSPSVRITSVPTDLLRFPPDPLPSTLPPPAGDLTLSHPFAIPTDVYNSLLSVHVPLTVALIYATTVIILNRLNANRNYKPWMVSTTRPFRAFVIAHNIFLALFSAWTFVGLLNAVRLSLDGAVAEHGLVGVVDALCKINGPRGLGDAATFNTSTSAWGFTNRALKLAANHLPDTTDLGRIWNEGLAFYGWLFYVSKFYEVVDTLIILAKGRKSSFLQTYHHAGAMMCMWAGIRYMAAPIWMFVLVNSLIHVFMYLYYAATTLGIRVPNRIKQIITTMQIAQFLAGSTFAFAHLFIAYTIPVSVPYTYSFTEIASDLASEVSSAASIATASASAGLGSWLKKIAFRAAGEEGLAENVRNEQGKPFGIDAIHAAKDLRTREEIRYRDELRMIHCTDTSGQIFAILFNCFYLAPLTWLFVRFFIRSYTKREVHQGKSSTRHLIEESGKDAAKAVKRELDQTLDETPGSMKDQNASQQPSSDIQTGSGKTSGSSKETHDHEERAQGSSNTTRGLSEERHGISEEGHDHNMERHGPSTERHDSDEERHEPSEAQHGLIEETHNSNQETERVSEKGHDSDKETHGLSEEARSVSEERHDSNEETHSSSEGTDDVSEERRGSSEGTQPSSEETRDPMSRHDSGEPATEAKKQDDGDSVNPDPAENADAPEDEGEKEDVEILDSAEVMKDVLADGLDNADGVLERS